jgi:mannosyltransferase
MPDAPVLIGQNRALSATDLNSEQSARPGLSGVILTIGVFAVIVAGSLLRWSGLNSQSLWLDEGYTLWLSRFSLADIWHALRFDTEAPLYHALIHYWCGFFGSTPWSLRALSALFGTLSCRLVYLLARRILRDNFAVALATALYAVSFYQVWYSKEARCYALLVFLCLGSVYCLLNCLDKSNPYGLLGLTLCVTASLYTHNMALFYLPGLALIWSIYPGRRQLASRFKDALIVFAAGSLLYAPWIGMLRVQMRGIKGNFWAAMPRPRDLLDTLCVMAGIDTATLQTVFRNRFHGQHLFGFWTWAPLVLLILVICVLGSSYQVARADRLKAAALAGYALLPIVLVFIDSRVSTSVYINRLFLAPCAVLPIVLCSPIAFQSGGRRLAFLSIGLLFLSGTIVSTFGYLRTEQKEDWRGVTSYLVGLPEERRLAVIVPDFAQVIVHDYAAQSPMNPPLEMTGLLTRYDPPDLDLPTQIFPNQGNGGSVALLSQAMTSGKYQEVDVAMRPDAWPLLVQPALQYLQTHCNSISVVQFHWLQIDRCFVQ